MPQPPDREHFTVASFLVVKGQPVAMTARPVRKEAAHASSTIGKVLSTGLGSEARIGFMPVQTIEVAELERVRLFASPPRRGPRRYTGHYMYMQE
jgi:hypothetical protein